MLNKIYFWAVVVTHYAIFVAFFVTCMLGWLVLPLYIYLTILALVVRVLFSTDHCPLTLLENRLRRKLKMKKSKGFIEDWIIKPLRVIKGKLNA